jgi:hypothetical protein
VPASRVTLLGRPCCHLCEEAREVVTGVLTEFPAVTFEELSIIDHPDLLDRYLEKIPVVLIEDRVHTVWRVDADRLRDALTAATAQEESESSATS